MVKGALTRLPRQQSNRRGTVMGTFASLKMPNTPVAFESSIERDLMFFLEFDATVISYATQPFTMKGISFDYEPHEYRPDFLVEGTTAQVLIECKPAKFKDDPHTQQQVTLGQQWAEDHDATFCLVTDEDLRTGPRLDNLKLLWRYARLAIPYTVAVQCEERLAGCPAGMAFWDLATDLADCATDAHHLAPCLYGLLFHHQIVADLDQPLTKASLLRLAQATQ